MTRFGAVRVLGEPDALSAARAPSTISAAGAVPAVVSGKPQIAVLRRLKEAILHYCEAISKLCPRPPMWLGGFFAVLTFVTLAKLWLFSR